MRYEMAIPNPDLPSRRLKLAALLKYDLPTLLQNDDVYDNNNNNNNSSSVTSTPRNSNSSGTPSSDQASSPRAAAGDANLFSPWHTNSSSSHPLSPYTKSPWIIPSPALFPNDGSSPTGAGDSLIGSIVRQEGHVYSLAASGDLLYTGSESKNIRVWKNRTEHGGFKSSSGLVKAIIIHGDRIFTGHQDGKIRVWKTPSYRRIGSLPTLKDSLRRSVNPKNYVEVRRRKNVLKIKHYDAVSCLALNSELGLLYSGSWDKTLKVWRVGNNNNYNDNNSKSNNSTSDFKCLESITAHDDAINAVATGFDSLVFTGSADGTVKVWKRELEGGRGGGGRLKHFLVQILLEQDSAVTALAVTEAVVYCGSSDGLVNFWEGEKQLSHGGALRGHKMAVLCLATAGSLVFSGSADKSICVWRRETLGGGDHVCLSVLTGHSGPVKCLAVEEEEEGEGSGGEEDQRWILYSGSLDRSVKIWRVDDHAPEWRDYQNHQHQHQYQFQSPRSSYYGYDNYRSPSPPTADEKKRQ